MGFVVFLCFHWFVSVSGVWIFQFPLTLGALDCLVNCRPTDVQSSKSKRRC